MGVLIAQLYWPVWLAADAYGHSYAGMLLGVLVVCFGWALWWKIEFNDWSFWKSDT